MGNFRKQITRTADGHVDPSSLGGLYPEAKTFDQKAQDDRERERLFIQRQPHLVRIKMALYTSVILSVIIYYIIAVQFLWAHGGIVGIFSSFGIALVLVFSTIACIQYALRIFYLFNRSASVFIVAELILIGIALYLFGYILKGNFEQSVVPLLTMTAIHFAALYVLLFLFIRYERS